MKDLSLNVLDVTHNSISAKASQITVSLSDKDGEIRIRITDDGCGMSEEMLRNVTDPFTTTRTTRRVGMGLPLLKMAAEQTGGSLSITSTLGEGTEVEALFVKDHIDCPPLGDMASTVSMLMGAVPAECDLRYVYSTAAGEFSVSTSEIREILGEDISLNEPEIQMWLKEYIEQQEKAIS